MISETTNRTNCEILHLFWLLQKEKSELWTMNMTMKEFLASYKEILVTMQLNASMMTSFPETPSIKSFEVNGSSMRIG
jgi:hypothetical protein